MIVILQGLLVVAIVWVVVREVWIFKQKQHHTHWKRRFEESQQALAFSEEKIIFLQEQHSTVVRFYDEKIKILDRSIHTQESLDKMCQNALLQFQKSCMDTLQPTARQWQSEHLKDQKMVLTQFTSPLGQALEQMIGLLQSVEKERVGAYQGLKEQIVHLSQGNHALQTQTHHLVTALRAPHVRGCWGEMQLRRILEISGMLPYCDFQEQVTLRQADQSWRPDVIVTLSKDRCVMIDAKAPILHYIDAVNEQDQQVYQKKLQDHEKALSQHVKKLSEKRYWQNHPSSVDFVLLFVPGDAFLSAALEVNPALIEEAAARDIIVASPSLLIAFLKTIAYGWRQEKIAAQTQQLVALAGKTLQYCHKLKEGLDQIGRTLGQTHTHYQRVVKILETQVMGSVEMLSSHAPEGIVENSQADFPSATATLDPIE